VTAEHNSNHINLPNQQGIMNQNCTLKIVLRAMVTFHDTLNASRSLLLADFGPPMVDKGIFNLLVYQ
jgi:hypothetical protein